MAPTVFGGITVLELGDLHGAAVAGRYLADYGALVTRVVPPAVATERLDPASAVLHRGKASVRADLETTEGRATIEDAIRAADVVIAGGNEAVLTAARLDHGSIAALNPTAIYALITPLGTSGPYAGVDGDEAIADAMNGHSGSQASEEGPPVYLVNNAASNAAGVATAGAIAAALRNRLSTGRGQRIDMSLLAAGLLTFPDGVVRRGGRNVLADVGVERDPLGSWPLFRAYETSDKDFVILGVANEPLWLKFALFVDHPEWIGDARLEGAPWALTAEGRKFLTIELEQLFRQRSRNEWLDAFAAAGIPGAAVSDGRALLQSEHVAANDLRIEVADRDLGPTTQVAPPIRFHRTPAVVGGHLVRDGQDAARPRTRASAGVATPAAPLSGVRVLNLSGYIAGAYGPTLLADLGAEVIKVESKDGDPFRQLALGFATYSRGQRVIVLDLKQAAARDVVVKLAASADVVVENFRVGTAEKLGLDYETLSKSNPRLIYLTASGFGTRGPRSGEAGFDILFQGEAGFMRAQGGSGAPVVLTSSVIDFTTGLMGAVAVMFGLWEREKSGVGQRIETGLMATALAMRAEGLAFGPAVSPSPSTGRDARGTSPVHRFYRAADGWLFLDARTRSRYDGLAASIGVSLPPFEVAMASPSAAHPASLIGAALESMPVSVAVDRLQAAGTIAVPVVPAAEALAHPQALANGYVDHAEHPVLGIIETALAMPRFSGMDLVRPTPAAISAQHTIEVLREAGCLEGEISALLASGAAVQGSVEDERSRIVLE